MTTRTARDGDRTFVRSSGSRRWDRDRRCDVGASSGGWRWLEVRGGTGIGVSEGDGSWFMLRWILDSTVFFICCIISPGLKDTLEPVRVDGGATGVGGSDA